MSRPSETMGTSIYQLEQEGNVLELQQFLERSESPAVRVRASEALGEVAEPDDSAVEVLIRTALEDEEARVRGAAIDALDAIGGNVLRRLLARRDDVEVDAGVHLPVSVLEDALRNDVPELRMAAANVVGADGVREALPTLLERVEDSDHRVQRRAVRAAGLLGDESVVDTLSGVVTSESTALRREAAVAFGEIGGERALDALGPLLEDDDLSVRREAVAALGRFTRCRPVGRLVEAFGDDAEEIRRSAAYAIVDLLSNAPAEHSHDLRSEVVAELSSTPGGVVVEVLVELYEESKEPHQRRNAAWLLGRVSDEDSAAVETLVAALDDDDEMVRQFAATSLVALDGPAVETALLEALDTTIGEGREMIIFVLGKIGTERSRRRLLKLKDDVEDYDVQERTLAALSRLGGTSNG